MKKILFLALAFVFSASVFAQDKMNHKMDKKMDHKMMMMKGGKTMDMDKDMTLSNGTMVMMDGSVKMKNGKTMMMKDGDMMSMNGKMSKKKMGKSMHGKM